MIRLGTRGSKLALAQSGLVAERLRAAGIEVETVIITTSGDRATSAPPDANATGIFVKELETELLAEGIDLAVHGLKDMPTGLPDGLTLGAIVKRGPALDAVVTRPRGGTLDGLPLGTRVGTSSPRRRAQIMRYRDDLNICPVRGNVDTRLRKLDAGAFDAIVLAHAGLERLGLVELEPYVIPPEVCLPAPGQGALAIEIRAGDARVGDLVQRLDDADTRACVTAERAFLHGLGGGCRAAVGALAEVIGDMMRLDGVVASPDGDRLIRGVAEGAPDDAEALGHILADDVRTRGADALIEAAR